ncbi:MAG: DUF6489 family protein [Pseudomonadota bacterium]
MKIKFDVECTPEEARTFFGLPDVVPMQQRLMDDMEAKMAENIQNLDPEQLVKTWLPLSVQGWGEVQKMFWAQMGMKSPMPDQSDSNNDA